jgi:hypothetical protein
VAHGARGGDAGVGDADVDAAALGDHLVDGGRDGVAVGDVAARPHGVAEPGGGLLDALAVEVEQRDAMGGGEPARGLQTDAASGAGDDGNGSGHGGDS